MTIRTATAGVAALVMALAIGAASARASEPAAAAGASASAVLDTMARFIDARQSYAVTIVSSMNVNLPQTKQNLVTTHQVTVQQPNRIAMRQTEGPPQAGDLVSDGQTLYASLPATARYVKQAAPATLQGLWQQDDPGARDRLIAVSQIAVINMLMMQSVQREAMLKAAAEQGTYVGVEPIGGRDCHHIRVTQNAPAGVGGLDLWIEAGDRPVLRRVTPDMSGVVAQLAQRMGPEAPKDMKVELNYELGDWQIDHAVAADAFAYQPKPGLALSESLVPEQAAQPQARRGKSGVGQPVPQNVKFQTLDGKEQELSKVANRIVVLDFWATWCGPCRMGLPGIQKLHDWTVQQKKPVSVYAVNVEEDAGQIQAFWKEQKFTMPVLMDSGPAAQAFGVNGIPHTVLIVDGVIQDVQVGYREGHEKHLQDKIESYLNTPAEGK
jgi:thiol-disulfide isomerase/thioredoxin